MRLLFDQNLSCRLVGLLAADYPISCHVAEVGLDEQQIVQSGNTLVFMICLSFLRIPILGSLRCSQRGKGILGDNCG